MKNKGFTLIELMIVVAIVAVLARIAYPAYSDYIMRARRVDAQSALFSTAQALERFYTENMGYKKKDGTASSLGSGSSDVAPTTSPDGFYTIAFDSDPANGTACDTTATSSPSTTAFRLCATPAGTQTRDTTCGTYSLSNTGVKATSTGAARCWN